MCRQRGVLFFRRRHPGPWACCRSTCRQTPVDFLAADGHKWLLGPEGAGIFYVRRELVERLHPVGVGWNSVVGATNFSQHRLRPEAARRPLGERQLNVAGITALGASLELLLEIGIDAICAARPGVDGSSVQRVAGARPARRSSAAARPAKRRASFRSWCPERRMFGSWCARCRGRASSSISAAGRVRVSPHFYNTTEETR